MSAATLARPLRVPLTWFVLAAFVLLSLLALESFGVRQAPSLVPIHNVSTSTSTDSSTTSNGSLEHCTDGHGQDGVMNPHCRAISND